MSNSHNSSASVVDVTVCPLQGRRKANDTPEKLVACVNSKENHKGYTVERKKKEKEGDGYCPGHNRAPAARVDLLWKLSCVATGDSPLSDRSPSQGHAVNAGFSVQE